MAKKALRKKEKMKAENGHYGVGSSYVEVEARLDRLARSRKRHGRPWVRDEEEFVRLFYGRVPTVELSNGLGRTCDSIEHCARRMRLRGVTLQCEKISW